LKQESNLLHYRRINLVILGLGFRCYLSRKGKTKQANLNHENGSKFSPSFCLTSKKLEQKYKGHGNEVNVLFPTLGILTLI